MTSKYADLPILSMQIKLEANSSANSKKACKIVNGKIYPKVRKQLGGTGGLADQNCVL